MRCSCILIGQIRAVLLALLCLILRRQWWSPCTCLTTECWAFCKKTPWLAIHQQAESQQFSLIRGQHILLPYARGTFARQKDWECVGENVSICIHTNTYIYMCACVRTNTHMERKTRNSNNIFYHEERRNFSFSPLNAVCLHGQHAAPWCKANTLLPFCRALSPRFILTLQPHAKTSSDVSNTEIFCRSVQQYSKWIWGKLSFHSLAINITKFFWRVEIFFAIQAPPLQANSEIGTKAQFCLQ